MVPSTQECYFCHAAFSGKDDRQAHQRACSSSPKRRTCKHCGQLFRNNDELRQHQKYDPTTGEGCSLDPKWKPQRCIHCHKTLKNMYAFNSHKNECIPKSAIEASSRSKTTVNANTWVEALQDVTHDYGAFLKGETVFVTHIDSDGDAVTNIELDDGLKAIAKDQFLRFKKVKPPTDRNSKLEQLSKSTNLLSPFEKYKSMISISTETEKAITSDGDSIMHIGKDPTETITQAIELMTRTVEAVVKRKRIRKRERMESGASEKRKRIRLTLKPAQPNLTYGVKPRQGGWF